MRIYRPGLLCYLFILIVLISAVSSGTNFYERHGNNFIYLESTGVNQFDTLTYAPIIWDIRAGSIQLRDYYVSYGWDSMDDCGNTIDAMDSLMKEASSHGVNFANARGDLPPAN